MFTIAACDDRRRCGSAAAAHPGDADDVDVEHPVPLLVVVGLDVARRADPGVVDHDVEPARARSTTARDRRVAPRPRSVTSQATREHAVRARRRESRSSTATRAPRSASRSAVAAPMPLAPPVTTATSPANSVMSCSASLVRAWVDVDLRAGAGAVRSPAGQHVADLVQPDRRGDQRARVDAPVGVRSIAPARPAEALSMPTAVTSLSTERPGVDQARAAGDSPM